eukprot:scaffold5539_cov81-Skeletonema_menzelii.AAC.2
MMARIASLLLSRLLLVSSTVATVVAVDSKSSSSSHIPRSNSNRSLQSNEAITEDQYQFCLNDLLTSDQNGDYELSADEFIRFVTFNSAGYGYTWGYAAGQTSLDKLPLNFPMLFYTQACLCSQDSESQGCCSAENAHIDIFAGPQYGSGITEKQDIYMRMFCTEAYHAYSVTFAPTRLPTPPPVTGAPTPSPVEATPSPTILSTTTTPPPTPLSTPDSTVASTPPPTPLPTTPQPTPAGTTTLLPIPVQYGISSDCGVTAYDVMTANRNTIKDGLEVATETAVINILNTTSWPWTKSSSSIRIANIPKKVGLEKNKVVAAATSIEVEEEEELVVELPHLIRYDELVPVEKRNVDDTVGNGVMSFMLLNQKPRRQRLLKQDGFSSDNQRQQKRLLSRGTNNRRNLVYYTSNNVEITDVEDSNQQSACPPGLNCMIVSSVVRVTLEPGDDPQVVTQTIEEGLQQSYQDGSFFAGIPEDTVLCPPEDSEMPSSSPTIANDETAEPTPLPSAAPTSASSGESTMMPSSVSSGESTMMPSSVSSGESTMMPSSVSSVESTMMPSSMASGTPVPTAPSTPITTGGNETIVPSMMPSLASSGTTATPSTSASGGASSMMPSSAGTTGDGTPAPSTNSSEATAPSAMPSISSGGESASPSAAATSAATLTKLLVTINYDIENQCGLDAEKVMNEDGNTLKSGLIAATTTVAINTLNTTFPREEEGIQRNMRGVRDNNYDRGLVYIDAVPDPTDRVYYTDADPVIIERILDIETGCDPGTNCLLIISTVTVLLEPLDDENAVKKALTDGISQSFRDGSFNSAIPADTVICPTRGAIRFKPPEPARLRARKR